MSTISVPYTFSSGAVIVASEHNSNFTTIYNDYNGSINNANCSPTMNLVDTKLATISTAGKVNVSALTIASQAQGDLLYASSGAAFSRLGAGTAGQTLTTGGAAANPSWTGMTTQGDVEFHNGTTRSRLAIGTAGMFLMSKGAAADPVWGTTIVTGTFTGTGAEKTVTIGFTDTTLSPKFVIVLNDTDGLGHMFITGMSSGIQISDGSKQAQGIKSVAANTFTVGTDNYANGNGDEIRWMAFT